MGKLLEVFGRAISVSTADVILYWASALIQNSDNTSLGSDFDDSQESELEKIIEMMTNSDLINASEYLTHYIAQNPESIIARMLRASIFIQENSLPEAINELQIVHSLEPSNTMALYALGICYERAGDIGKSTAFYQDCIKFKNYLQLPTQRLAAINLRNGNISKCVELYKQLTDQYPDDVESLVLLGYLYLSNHEYEEAVETFNTAILIHPDNLQSDNERDDIHLLIESGNLREALDQINYLFEEVGEMPDLYIKLGDVMVAAKNSKEALAAYEKALSIQPNYMEANIKLATLHLNEYRYAMAAESFNRAVELNDQVVDAYIGLACGHILCGHKKHGMETISLAASLQENSSLLFAETASLNFQSAISEGFMDSSITTPEEMRLAVLEAHQRQVLDNKGGADSHYKLGLLYMSQKNHSKAIAAFKKALEINNTHHRSRSKLSICYYEIGDKTAAVDLLVEPDVLDSDILGLHYDTAVLFSDRRRFALAVDNLENYIKDNYSDSDTRESIQVVLENLSLLDRASTSWDRLCYTTYSAIKGVK